MGHPRFIFSATWGPGLGREVLRTERGVPDLTDAPTIVHWRLLSANNRQLGRSSEVFDDVAAARAAALGLQERLEQTEQFIVRIVAPARWVWTLLDGSSVVAVSGRSYENERAVAQALRLFLVSAAHAPVATVERLPRPRRNAHPAMVLPPPEDPSPVDHADVVNGRWVR